MFSRAACRRSAIAFASRRSLLTLPQAPTFGPSATIDPDEDIFAVQSDVTAKIANTLGSQVGVVRKSQFKLAQHKPPNSLTAYDTYLMADAVALTPVGGVTKDGLIEGEKLFHKAIELDPQMARAYVGLAYVYSLMYGYGFADSPEQALSKQLEAAQKAVELDPNNNRAHGALGQALAWNGQWAQALVEFDRAEALAPNDADTLAPIALNIAAGEFCTGGPPLGTSCFAESSLPELV